MLDLMTSSLQSLKGLWGRLPFKALVLIATGVFDLGAIGGLSFARTQVGDGEETPLTSHLATALDAALIVLVALLVIVAVASVAYAIAYRDARLPSDGTG